MSIDTSRSGQDRVDQRSYARPTAPDSQAPLPPAPVRPKERRRPLLIAAMVALVCIGALLSAYAYLSTSDAESVLAVRDTVNRGEVIEAEDLVSVQVSLDPILKPLSSSEREEVVGRRAAVDLAAGTLVTAESVASVTVPAAGQSIVGVSLTSAMMPSEALYTGDAVRLVSTPGDQGEIRTGVEPVTIEATVVGLREVPETGDTVVDVSVPADQAADLASRAATRKVALVLDSRER